MKVEISFFNRIKPYVVGLREIHLNVSGLCIVAMSLYSFTVLVCI